MLKHVGVFIMYFNVNVNILKQINCALVGLIKDWILPHINNKNRLLCLTGSFLSESEIVLIFCLLLMGWA
jgi:hypothetical protein